MGMAPVSHVLFNKFMKFNPKNPKWVNRDRFVLSYVDPTSTPPNPFAVIQRAAAGGASEIRPCAIISAAFLRDL